MPVAWSSTSELDIDLVFYALVQMYFLSYAFPFVLLSRSMLESFLVLALKPGLRTSP